MNEEDFALEFEQDTARSTIPVSSGEGTNTKHSEMTSAKEGSWSSTGAGEGQQSQEGDRDILDREHLRQE
jgi:hypothetical protein